MKKQLLRQFPVVLGLIVLTLGLFLPTSCTKDIFPGAPDDDLVEMVITVGGNTKTANDGDATIWTEGDQLSVIHSAPNATTFWLSPFTYNSFYGPYAFYGTVSKLSANNDWYAVYPYDAKHVSAENISLNFPASQVQTGNGDTAHLAGETMPMVGKTENVARTTDLSIRMQNLLSVAEFNITNTREQEQDASIFIKSVQMTASVPLAGAFTVDLTGEKPVLTAGANATKTVTLTVKPEEEGNPQPLFIPFGETAKFYVAIAPFTAPAGSQIKVKIIAAPSYAPGVELVYYHTITLISETLFESSSIKPILVSFDETKSENPDGGSGGEVELEEGEQPEDGEYLLVYENGANSMAFAAFDEYKSDKYAIPVTVVDGVVIPKDGEDLSRFVVTLENTGEEHPNDEGHYAYNVRNSEGKYVFYATAGGTYEGTDALHILDSNEMEVQGTNYKYYHTFTQTTDGVRIVCSINTGGNYYLLSYSTEDGFNYQQDNASGTNLHLYQLGGAAKEKQHLNFDPDTITYDYDAGGDFPEPALSGAQTPVSYTSSNEAVATVAPDGTVTIHKAGSATITAKAEASETYYAATASYTILSKTSKTRTFYLTTELAAGEEYVIVSAGQALTNNDGTIGATGISAADGVVLVADDAIVWTAAASGSGFTFANDGYYVQRGSGTNGSPSISKSPTSNYAAWTYSNNRLAAGSYYLYYSSGWKQTSSTSTAGSLTLYSSTKPLTPQSLSFEKPNVRWTVGEGQDYRIGSSYTGQSVSGAKTEVTYTSSNTDVATVSGTTVTVKALGTTTITATAAASGEYKAGSASYTLRIAEPLPGGFTDLGTFNLENDKVSAFLDEAEDKYTNDNYTSTSIVGTYSSSASNTNRLDIPKPVTLTWDSASSGTTTVTIFADQALEDIVWTQTTTAGKTSDDVYNLIPGRTYYCTVEDAGGLLLKGAFNTEGRRRMIKASNTADYARANNFRDLGGLKTVDGKTIKFGMIFRGTNLDSTTDEEQGLMANYLNIGWDIDLRQNTEGKEAFSSKYSVVYEMSNYYPSLAELTTASKVKQTMTAFIDAAIAGKASYFHCRIGSDRTGYWGLLIEGLLGVSAKDCSMDFELTSFAKNVTSGNRERNSSGYLFYQGMEDFKKKSYYATFKAEDESTALMKTINQYLVEEVGISQDDIDTFKSIILE